MKNTTLYKLLIAVFLIGAVALVAYSCYIVFTLRFSAFDILVAVFIAVPALIAYLLSENVREDILKQRREGGCK